MIFIDTIKNETQVKQMQKTFSEQFHLMSKELAPDIAAFMVDNHIPVTVAIYFFGGLIKDALETIPNENDKNGLKKVIVNYIDK